jgi:hypothetical protein
VGRPVLAGKCGKCVCTTVQTTDADMLVRVSEREGKESLHTSFFLQFHWLPKINGLCTIFDVCCGATRCKNESSLGRVLSPNIVVQDVYELPCFTYIFFCDDATRADLKCGMSRLGKASLAGSARYNSARVRVIPS